MPKRKKYEEELKQLNKRLKQIEKEVKEDDTSKKKRGRRRRILSSSSSSSSSSSRENSANRSQNEDHTSSPISHEEAVLTLPPEPDTEVNQPLLEESSNKENQPPIDDNIMEILGVDPTKSNVYGKAIQGHLSIRLEYIVTQGLPKDMRKELIDKYLIPDNCKTIDAPGLNPEVKVALSENVIKRDKAIEAKQKITASAISALGEAITLLLQKPDINKEALRILMDSGRLMCDSQHNDTTTRRNYVMFAVKKEMKQSLQETKVDSLLFGQNLSETLKNAKAINKSGADLKVTTPKPNSIKKYTPSTSKNWKNIASRRQTTSSKMRETTMPATGPKTQQRWPTSKQSQNHRASYNRR